MEKPLTRIQSISNGVRVRIGREFLDLHTCRYGFYFYNINDNMYCTSTRIYSMYSTLIITVHAYAIWSLAHMP